MLPRSDRSGYWQMSREGGGGWGVERKQGFVMGVNGCKVRRQLARSRDRRRLIVDEYSAFAAGRNIAAQDDRFVLLVDSVVFQNWATVFSAPPSTSNTAEIVALSAPERITSAEALSPSRSARASMRMFFPAPVSPVRKLSRKRTPLPGCLRPRNFQAAARRAPVVLKK